MLFIRDKVGSDSMTEYRAGRIDEFKEGGRLLLKCGDAEIGIFMIDGEFHAWHNACAHRGGPVCQGRIMKRVVEPGAFEIMVGPNSVDLKTTTLEVTS